MSILRVHERVYSPSFGLPVHLDGGYIQLRTKPQYRDHTTPSLEARVGR